MKKRISILLSFLLVFCMLSQSFALNLSASGINSAVDKIYSLPKDKRETLYIAGAPLLITDSGVDSLINMVNNYTAGGGGLFDSYIEMMLKYTDADTLVRSLKTIKCVSPSIRQNYVDIFDRKTELDMTNAESETFSAFMANVYKQINNLKPLLSDFEITDAVVANLLCMVKEINEYPLLKISGGKFAVNKTSSSLQNSVNEIWEGTERDVSLAQSAEEFAELINTCTEDISIDEITPIFQKIGLLAENTQDDSGSSGGSSSGGGSAGGSTSSGTTTPESPSNVVITELEKIDGIETNGKIYSISVANGMAKVTVCEAKEGLALYKVNGTELAPVKLSVVADGFITALLTGDAAYVVQKANAAPFKDVNGWGKAYIEELYAKNIINGKTETEFMPEASITREEFVKLIVEMFDLTDENAKCEFKDVAQNSWYEKYVASAYNAGIVNGISETEFGVGQKIKRQDMAKIIVAILNKNGISTEADANGINDYEKIADYAKNAAAQMKAFGIISGDENGNFNPESFATRQEAAKMLYGLLETYVKQK